MPLSSNPILWLWGWFHLIVCRIQLDPKRIRMAGSAETPEAVQIRSKKRGMSDGSHLPRDGALLPHPRLSSEPLHDVHHRSRISRVQRRRVWSVRHLKRARMSMAVCGMSSADAHSAYVEVEGLLGFYVLECYCYGGRLRLL